MAYNIVFSAALQATILITPATAACSIASAPPGVVAQEPIAAQAGQLLLQGQPPTLALAMPTQSGALTAQGQPATVISGMVTKIMAAAAAVAFAGAAPAITQNSVSTQGPVADRAFAFYGSWEGGTIANLTSGTCACGMIFDLAAPFYNGGFFAYYVGAEGVMGRTYEASMKLWSTGAAANGIPRVWYQPHINCEMHAFESGGSGDTFLWLQDAIEASNGSSGTLWLLATYPSGSPVPATSEGASGNSYVVNISNTNTDQTTKGVASGYTLNGKTWNVISSEYYLDMAAYGTLASKYGESANMAANPYICGIFRDNVETLASDAGAWQAPGNGASLSITAAAANWQLGYAQQFAADRAYTPPAGQLASQGGLPGGQWLVGGNNDAYNHTSTALQAGYAGGLDICLSEGYFGTTYGGDHYGAIQGFINLTYQRNMLTARGRLIVLSYGRSGGTQTAFPAAQSSWTTGVNGEWQDARAQLCFAFIAGCYYSNSGAGTAGGNGNASSTCLFDEMYQLGKCGYEEIGSGTADPQQNPGTISGTSGTGAWSQGVYRRRRPGATVLWNPRGNGVKTFTVGTGAGQIPPGLQRCSAFNMSAHSGGLAQYGDPAVNNGAVLVAGQTVTLNDGGYGDGLVLLGGLW